MYKIKINFHIRTRELHLEAAKLFGGTIGYPDNKWRQYYEQYYYLKVIKDCSWVELERFITDVLNYATRTFSLDSSTKVTVEKDKMPVLTVERSLEKKDRTQIEFWHLGMGGTRNEILLHRLTGPALARRTKNVEDQNFIWSIDGKAVPDFSQVLYAEHPEPVVEYLEGTGIHTPEERLNVVRLLAQHKLINLPDFVDSLLILE